MICRIKLKNYSYYRVQELQPMKILLPNDLMSIEDRMRFKWFIYENRNFLLTYAHTEKELSIPFRNHGKINCETLFFKSRTILDNLTKCMDIKISAIFYLQVLCVAIMHFSRYLQLTSPCPILFSRIDVSEWKIQAQFRQCSSKKWLAHCICSERNEEKKQRDVSVLSSVFL